MFLGRTSQTRWAGSPSCQVDVALSGWSPSTTGWVLFAVRDLSSKRSRQLGSASPRSTPASQLLVATQAAVLQPWGFSVSDSKVPLKLNLPSETSCPWRGRHQITRRCSAPVATASQGYFFHPSAAPTGNSEPHTLHMALIPACKSPATLPHCLLPGEHWAAPPPTISFIQGR